MLSAPEMTLTEINGVTFELYDSGGPGDPVLLIHSTRDDWYGVIQEPALTDKFRVILPHRRGWGRSDPPEGQFSFADHAWSCRQLLEKLGIERAHIAGLSIGGSMALQFAKDSPERVQSLAIFEPAMMEIVAKYPETMEVLGKAAGLFQSGDIEGAITIHFEELCGPGAWETLPRETFERLMKAAGTLYEAEGAAIAEWSYSESDWAAISQPFLNVSGEGTRPYYKQGFELIKTMVPHAENVIIENTRHPILQTQPGNAAELLADFFSRHPIGVPSSRAGHTSSP